MRRTSISLLIIFVLTIGLFGCAKDPEIQKELPNNDPVIIEYELDSLLIGGLSDVTSVLSQMLAQGTYEDDSIEYNLVNVVLNVEDGVIYLNSSVFEVAVEGNIDNIYSSNYCQRDSIKLDCVYTSLTDKSNTDMVTTISLSDFQSHLDLLIIEDMSLLNDDEWLSDIFTDDYSIEIYMEFFDNEELLFNETTEFDLILNNNIYIVGGIYSRYGYYVVAEFFNNRNDDVVKVYIPIVLTED